MTKRHLVATLLAAAIAVPALADEDLDERGLPVTNEVAREECGSCHVPYPPQFLPARSWRTLLNTLHDHFGEDASVSPSVHDAILEYLVANAADASRTRAARAFSRGVAPGDTPLRVTETPMWRSLHLGVGPHWWADPEVGSKANCGACHGRADEGIFGDMD